jgi:hypothetical protein
MANVQSNITPRPDPDPTIRRRGLLGLTAAFVAGLIARFTEQPLQAGTDGDVIANTWTLTSSTTTVRMGTPYSSSGAALLGLRHTSTLSITPFYRVGVYGHSASDVAAVGVFGEVAAGTNGIGVQGFGAGSGSGVFGLCNFGGQGVLGQSETAIGVHGQSRSGVAVFGEVPSESNENTIAIYAQNYSTYAGQSAGAGGFGVYGLSAKGHGLVGATAAAGAAAVVGATNGVAGAYAAAFYGPVIVGGAFTVVGGAKSAAVPHPDGSHRRLYCLESPESWFEDFGTSRLDCGRAEVRIDPDFAAVADVSEYHVFLTGYGTDDLLHVKERTPTGFMVEADLDFAAIKGKLESDLDGAFGWRVVAKRKDIEGKRLETVTVPPEPALPAPMPAAPPPPRPHGEPVR